MNDGIDPSNTSETLTFVAKAENAYDISQVLNTIYKPETDKNKKKDIQQYVTVKIGPAGIHFIVEEGKHYQGRVSFKSTFFQEYHFTPNLTGVVADQNQQEVMFRISLSMILDSLTIFGNSGYTQVQFLYKGYGSPLVLLLEEGNGGVETHCSIKTLEADDTLEFDLITPVSNKILIESENLLEAFGELDFTSTILNIALTPESPFFVLSTSGQMGSFKMEYCKKDTPDEIFEFFDLSNNINFNYQLALIKPCIKALTLAKKTRLTLTQEGLLSFTHIIPIGSQQHLVEFFILATTNQFDEDINIAF
ncbi:hypothetical protein DICPUDRAFT_34318 [Dictyostelium purpureum]|uniref:Uncharacterized protein n=1 Tax=Dictyostelium purpureum TaxID=5786 RepID=F0ZMH0_DICPU|nr:uncharacterized protein DICPUDRAFT_34318 [Dictyostelium purpureum]EGC34853.1 hypothetical protein DICPUDRAFT_34318 [Dictyostelium purpureum]|eukprot:XP_003288607.1 hypothetical protein DICPUDRAFT_34318 [Dictyostelium purpureum]